MLVDSTKDLVCVVQQLVKKYKACFSGKSAPLTESYLDKLESLPVLGRPPNVLVILAQATKLALSDTPLSEASFKTVQNIQSNSGRKMWTGKLDMLTIRALISRNMHIRHASTLKFHEFMFRQSIKEGL